MTMVAPDRELKAKAKRRIRRLIATGEHQARVRQQDDVTFIFWVKHHVTFLKFKKNKLGHLRVMKP